MKNNTLTCYGEQLTFEALKVRNTSVDDLFQWQATIDTIDAYAKYLEESNGLADKEIYCNCTDNEWFGSRCQYSIENAVSPDFDQILHHRFLLKLVFLSQWGLTAGNITCYRDWMCNPLALCFDWRQICDGIVDCENGEDEEHCMELETNTCHMEKQYRCRNGMCIERKFAFDQIWDCMDGSDEFNSTIFDCLTTPSIQCEEFNWVGRNFPNTDLQLLVNSVDESTRNYLYHEDLLVFRENSSCVFGKYIVCGFRIRSLHKHVVSDGCDSLCVHSDPDCTSKIVENCSTPFFFPTNSVAFPGVRFLYFTNTTQWDHSLPEYICYNDTLCTSFPTTETIHGHRCRASVDIGLPSEESNYIAFYDRIAKLFSSCYISNVSCSSHPLLFKCNLTNICISKYRLNDFHSDCISGDDESEENVQDLHLTDRMPCLNKDPDKDLTVPRWLYSNARCISNIRCEKATDGGCGVLRSVDPISPFHSLFREICNGVESKALTVDNETDETNCYEFYHLCSAKYRSGNTHWDCVNGFDEICNGNPNICDKKGHFCLRLDPFSNTYLDMKYAGDGFIDCVGGSDERLQHCPQAYPTEIRRRFQCLNSTICLSVDTQICDGVFNCPLEDDEHICPPKNTSACEPGQFICRLGKCLDMQYRCDGTNDCDDAEDELFCDLIDFRQLPSSVDLKNDFNQYPFRDEMVFLTVSDQSHEQLENNMIFPSNLNNMYANPSYIANTYYCNRGFVFKSRDDTGDVCLCPPSYYGDRCEYQSERLTVYLQAEIAKRLGHVVFKLLICLIIEDDSAATCEYVIHYTQSEVFKHIVYLLHSRPKTSVDNFSIRISAFSVTSRNVTFYSSWYFPIAFQFLPVNRLTAYLMINDRSEIVLCGSCLHGVCVAYINFIDKSFCLCDQNWQGSKCDIPSSVTCADGSRPVEEQCLCTLGRIGLGCYIQNDTCNANSCKNGGTCFMVGETFDRTCFCPETYFGDLCQHIKAQVLIDLLNQPSDLSILRIPIVLVHLVDIDNATGLLSLKLCSIYKNVPLHTTISALYNQELLPAFIYVQLFYNTNTFYGLYHLVGFIRQVKRLQTSVLPSNRCPH
ncbi:unnamed protein product, partial [Didymodactylos carnosus]